MHRGYNLLTRELSRAARRAECSPSLLHREECVALGQHAGRCGGGKVAAAAAAARKRGGGGVRYATSPPRRFLSDDGRGKPRHEFIELSARLRTCAKRGDLAQALSVLREIDERGYPRDGHVLLHLMEVLGRCGRGKQVLDVFESLPRPNIYHFNYVIAMLARFGRLEEAEAMYVRMTGSAPNQYGRDQSRQAQSRQAPPRQHSSHVLSPDQFTFNGLLLGAAKRGHLAAAEGYIAEMKRLRIPWSQITYNTLIHLHAKRRDPKAAGIVLEEMVANGVPVTEEAFNALLTSYVEAGNVHGAVLLFEAAVGEGSSSQDEDGSLTSTSRLPLPMPRGREGEEGEDSRTCATPPPPPPPSSISADGGGAAAPPSLPPTGRLEALIGILADQTHLKLTIHACGALITAFARASLLDHALAVFEGLKRSRLAPNDYIQNAVLDAYVKCGQIENGRRFLDELRVKGGRIRPDVVAFNTLLFGYSTRADTTAVTELFAQMVADGVQPNARSFNACAKAYLRNGEYERARQILTTMSVAGDYVTRMLRRSAGLEGESAQIVALSHQGLDVQAVELLQSLREQGVAIDAAAMVAAANSLVKVKGRFNADQAAEKVTAVAAAVAVGKKGKGSE